MKKSLILLVILFLISLCTSKLVKAADFASVDSTSPNYTSTPVPQMLGAQKSKLADNGNLSKTAVTVSPYKDNNEKLYSVVGKTQMIKFDEPVKRISITDPSLADLVLLSPKELMINGKKTGRTSLVFWGESNKPVFFNLIVQQDTDAVLQAVEQIAPGEDVKYAFTDDGLIMSGHISSTTVKNNIEDVIKAYNIKLVDLTESPTKQVLLEIKITEASRDFTRSLESNFSVGENYDNFLTKVLGITNHQDISNASLVTGAGQYIYSSSAARVAWALTAAETKGYVKILAEPKLLAMDGKPGSFNVGEEIPVPSQVAMGGTVAYTFKTAGVVLNFTPTILEKSNRVILKLAPEVSEVGNNYNGQTGFKTRKIDSTVELGDGETLILAGLLKHSSTETNMKVPWLGDLPGVGYLFKKLNREKHDIELVIFITPKIVEVDKNGNRVDL